MSVQLSVSNSREDISPMSFLEDSDGLTYRGVSVYFVDKHDPSPLWTSSGTWLESSSVEGGFMSTRMLVPGVSPKRDFKSTIPVKHNCLVFKEIQAGAQKTQDLTTIEIEVWKAREPVSELRDRGIEMSDAPAPAPDDKPDGEEEELWERSSGPRDPWYRFIVTCTTAEANTARFEAILPRIKPTPRRSQLSRTRTLADVDPVPSSSTIAGNSDSEGTGSTTESSSDAVPNSATIDTVTTPGSIPSGTLVNPHVIQSLGCKMLLPGNMTITFPLYKLQIGRLSHHKIIPVKRERRVASDPLASSSWQGLPLKQETLELKYDDEIHAQVLRENILLYKVKYWNPFFELQLSRD
ncbi:hypothetical protein BC835DRAFT_1309947 [Cytidiella melzeri]|nr:hypothetical protein BC835DRAFT_1309947 [Cytidiella melzeri]